MLDWPSPPPLPCGPHVLAQEPVCEFPCLGLALVPQALGRAVTPALAGFPFGAEGLFVESHAASPPRVGICQRSTASCTSPSERQTATGQPAMTRCPPTSFCPSETRTSTV